MFSMREAKIPGVGQSEEVRNSSWQGISGGRVIRMGWNIRVWGVWPGRMAQHWSGNQADFLGHPLPQAM